MKSNNVKYNYTCLACKNTFATHRALSVHQAKSTFCSEFGNISNNINTNLCPLPQHRCTPAHNASIPNNYGTQEQNLST